MGTHFLRLNHSLLFLYTSTALTLATLLIHTVDASSWNPLYNNDVDSRLDSRRSKAMTAERWNPSLSQDDTVNSKSISDDWSPSLSQHTAAGDQYFKSTSEDWSPSHNTRASRHSKSISDNWSQSDRVNSRRLSKAVEAEEVTNSTASVDSNSLDENTVATSTTEEGATGFSYYPSRKESPSGKVEEVSVQLWLFSFFYNLWLWSALVHLEENMRDKGEKKSK